MWYVFVWKYEKISHVWKCTPRICSKVVRFSRRRRSFPEGGYLSLLKDVYWFGLWYLNACNTEVTMNSNVNCVVLIFYHNWKVILGYYMNKILRSLNCHLPCVSVMILSVTFFRLNHQMKINDRCRSLFFFTENKTWHFNQSLLETVSSSHSSW